MHWTFRAHVVNTGSVHRGAVSTARYMLASVFDSVIRMCFLVFRERQAVRGACASPLRAGHISLSQSGDRLPDEG